MDIGIFDHLDRRNVALDEHYASRLRLLEKYDAAGFHAYHLAEHHATPLGMAPVPGIFLAAATQRTRRIRLAPCVAAARKIDRQSTRLNSSHVKISYAGFCSQ